jgi:cystatin-8
MAKPLWLSLILFIIPVALAVGVDQSKNEVKAQNYFGSINISNANVKQCVWFAMKEYNKESEDKYVFLVDKILHAKLQVRKFYFLSIFTYCDKGGGQVVKVDR